MYLCEICASVIFFYLVRFRCDTIINTLTTKHMVKAKQQTRTIAKMFMYLQPSSVDVFSL